MASPSPSPSWVILSRAARASATGDDLPQGAAPPRVTSATLHPSVCPVDPPACSRQKFPHVLAADPSGLLLFLTPPSPSDVEEGSLCTWRDENGVERSFRVSRIPNPRYLVCDVSSPAAASPVPNPDSLNNQLGVIAAPGGGGRFMVVEFQHIVGGRRADLLCFSSENGEWVQKEVVNPLPRWMWTFADIVSHGGKVWWVDTVAGLLACDPFADQPVMEYVRLPEGDVKRGHGCGYCSERALGSRRVVQLSNGNFCCVEMSCASNGGAPKVSVRALADPGTAEWTLEYEAIFSEIWAAESYKATGLPEKTPVLALIHPKNPDVVYFFLEDHLFGVDMRTKSVVECEPYESSTPRKKGSFSSWLVLPFELPPAFSAGLGNEASSTPPTSAPAAGNRV